MPQQVWALGTQAWRPMVSSGLSMQSVACMHMDTQVLKWEGPRVSSVCVEKGLVLGCLN